VTAPAPVANEPPANRHALAAAVDDNIVAYWRACAPLMPGGAWYEDGDLTWFETGVSTAPWLNQVLRTRLTPENADERIDEMLAAFDRRGTPMLWSVSPSDNPADLDALLQRGGLVRGGGVLTGMAMLLHELPELPEIDGFRLERVRDDNALARWMNAYVAGFGMTEDQAQPFFDLYRAFGYGDDAPFRHYAGTLEGEAVASSTAFLGAGNASIWHVGTLPAARRRGIGTAMTLAPLRDARDLGLTIGVLGSSEAGYSIYEKLGFQTFGKLVQYRWPA